MFGDVFISKQRERNIAGEKPQRLRGALGGELRVTLFGEFFLAVTAFLPDPSSATCSHGTVSSSQRSHGAQVCTAQEPEGGPLRDRAPVRAVWCGAPGSDRTEAGTTQPGEAAAASRRPGRGLGTGTGTTVRSVPDGSQEGRVFALTLAATAGAG